MAFSQRPGEKTDAREGNVDAIKGTQTNHGSSFPSRLFLPSWLLPVEYKKAAWGRRSSIKQTNVLMSFWEIAIT